MTEAWHFSGARTRLALVSVVLAVVWLTMLLAGRDWLDRSVYQALYAGTRPSLIIIARFFTALGEPTVLIGASVCIALWLWYRRSGRLGLALLLITMTGRALSEVQKYWIARARPDLEPHLVVVKTNSFPSGHAASSIIFYVTLGLILSADTRWSRRVPAVAVLLSLLIGTSRVMLGVHWPSDVIGGWAFGMLWVLLTLRLAHRLLETDSAKGADRL
jgi:undecaprenyl-diphosphatase